jgi:DNA-damage-inducible protein J
MATTIPRKQTSIKVDPVAWKSAKKIFKEYGLTASDAINVFLNKVRLENDFPFEFKVPNKETIEAMMECERGECEEISFEQLKEEMKQCIVK